MLSPGRPLLVHVYYGHYTLKPPNRGHTGDLMIIYCHSVIHVSIPACPLIIVVCSSKCRSIDATKKSTETLTFHLRGN